MQWRVKTEKLRYYVEYLILGILDIDRYIIQPTPHASRLTFSVADYIKYYACMLTYNSYFVLRLDYLSLQHLLLS